MIDQILNDKPAKIFIGFTTFFVANALAAEAIGTKLFSLEGLFGLDPVNFTLFDQAGLAFTLTCGVWRSGRLNLYHQYHQRILWP